MSNTPSPSPANVVFLGSQIKTKEVIIQDYLDILVTCRKADEFYQCLSMLFDDVTIRTGELILEKQIQKNVEILEELRK